MHPHPMLRGRLIITLAPLQCIDSRELNSFLLVQHPQIGNAYVTEGKITLKYKSKSEFLGKKWLCLIRLSLLRNPLLSSDMCFVHVSLLSSQSTSPGLSDSTFIVPCIVLLLVLSYFNHNMHSVQPGL